MKNTPSFRRSAVAASMVAAAVLMLCSVVLQPEFPATHSDRLAAIDAAGASAAVSAVTFTLAQLPFLIAMLGAAHLLRRRTPVLSALTAVFGLLGGFGHTVYGGISLVMLSMAADEANREAYADVLGAVESGAGVPFMGLGLLGTVLGVLMLAIGLGRGRVGPRWLPFVLGAFLLVEFAGAGLSEWASSLATALYLVALVTLAVVACRSPLAEWATPAEETSALAVQEHTGTVR